MILVDTSVWIDHLHHRQAQLTQLLENDDVGCHPAVTEELALGSIKERTRVLGLLAQLWQFPTVSHDEVLALVNARQLWGRGLSAVDVQLLGSVALVPGAQLWSRDSRLIAACRECGVASLVER